MSQECALFSSLSNISSKQAPAPSCQVELPPDQSEEYTSADFATSPANLEVDESGNVQLEKRGVTSHEYQGNLWTSQTVFKFSIAAKLRGLSIGDRADELEKCHTQITYARCKGCTKVRKFLNRCDRFYCPECQPRLSRERKESIEWWTKSIPQPKHVVLTIRNTDTLERSHVKEIKSAFSRLRRTRFCHNWNGGFYSVECTNEGRGWHLHIHALVDARYIDCRELAIQWEKATRGQGNIVKVKDCRNKSYLQEVTKYAVKGSDLAKWSPLDILKFINAFEGTRQFGVFGSLYRKRTEWKEWIESLRDKKSRCECGCNDFSFHSEREWEVIQAVLIPVVSVIPPPRTQHLEFSFATELTPKWHK